MKDKYFYVSLLIQLYLYRFAEKKYLSVFRFSFSHFQVLAQVQDVLPNSHRFLSLFLFSQLHFSWRTRFCRTAFLSTTASYFELPDH